MWMQRTFGMQPRQLARLAGRQANQRPRRILGAQLAGRGCCRRAAHVAQHPLPVRLLVEHAAPPYPGQQWRVFELLQLVDWPLLTGYCRFEAAVKAARRLPPAAWLLLAGCSHHQVQRPLLSLLLQLVMAPGTAGAAAAGRERLRRGVWRGTWCCRASLPQPRSRQASALHARYIAARFLVRARRWPPAARCTPKGLVAGPALHRSRSA